RGMSNAGGALAAAGALSLGRDRPRVDGARLGMRHPCCARLFDACRDPRRSYVSAAGSGALLPVGCPGLGVGGVVPFMPFHGPDGLARRLRRYSFDLPFGFLDLP